MGKYFGTDGFRGEAGITLTADHAYKVGRFLGWYYNALRERNGDTNPARIVIGKDTRRSSYMFEYSLVAGLTASGADAYLLHVTTTPSVAYIARVDDFDCGIMISASHNPYYDNGIKLIDCYGEKMPEETLLLVEDYIDGKLHVFDKDWPELPFAHREHIGCTVDYVAGRNRYMGYLISLGIYSFKGVKVGLDCANGSSWNIAKSVFDALGADTYAINNKPNGTNINTNAGSTHIEGLQKFVVEKGLDVGFAFDGDADRCLCVDEKGDVITGDHILYIYGCYMKERGKLLNNTVVTTVMSNFGLYKAFDEQGIGYAKTAVGDKYVYEYMAKNGCRIGGEQSGHIIFSKYASTGDGILTSLKMMEVMLAKKKPMSELAAPLKIYPQVLENVRVTDKKAAQNDPVVQEAVSKVAEALGDTGRILSTANTLKLSKASVTSYLPYRKGVYFPSTAEKGKISVGAERQRRYRAMKQWRGDPTEENFWGMAVSYAGVGFKTYSGLPFSYEIKKGRNGEYTKELWIDRREKNKSLAWSSVLLALKNIKGEVVDRPKALGDIRGVTYIYGMFYRFGLIDVPDEVKEKMGHPKDRKK